MQSNEMDEKRNNLNHGKLILSTLIKRLCFNNSGNHKQILLSFLNMIVDEQNLKWRKLSDI